MPEIKLICFDLDLTLINHASWQTLGAELGVSPEKDAELYKYYIDGKITYQEWNDKILEIYRTNKDLSKKRITEILSRYVYSDGAEETIAYLRSKGYVVVLISGSMDILVDMVAQDLGIPHAKANNTFLFDKNDLLQEIRGEGDDVQSKLEHLETFCHILGIGLHECACVGDGANDIKMFQSTGHGITFVGSPIEKEAWKVIGTLADLKNIF